MALQPTIQYVSFYVDGSTAKKIERKVMPQAAAPTPKYRKVKRRVVRIDPVAIVGILASVIMLIAMIAGINRYQDCVLQQQQMSQYIQDLQKENIQLDQTYKEGYDLEEIREIAEAIGMVPSDQVEHITIDVQVPEKPVEPEPSFWEEVGTFLAGLFA